MNAIESLFGDKETILNAIKNHDSIVELLGYPSNKCGLIDGNKIQLGIKQGQGVSGSAFDVVINRRGVDQTYIVKTGKLKLSASDGTKADILKWLEQNKVKKETFLYFQSDDFNKKFNKANNNEYFNYVNFPPLKCLNSSGNYICPDESFSELAIGMYMGNLWSENICANFFDVYTMFTCKNKETHDYTKYIFMQKINGTLDEYGICMARYLYVNLDSDKRTIAMNGLYVQTIFAIATYQELLGVSHNDLHDKNVFIDEVSDKTEFMGVKLQNVDYYQYNITYKGIQYKIYFPAIPLIVKIGDFGWSMKYTDPVVGCEQLLRDGYSNVPDNNGNMPSYTYMLPIEFNKYYDCQYFTMCFWSQLSAIDNNPSDVITNCINRAFGVQYAKDSKINEELVNRNLISKDLRPVIPNIRPDAATPLQLLLGPIYDKFRTKPPASSKIAIIGNIIIK